MLHRQTSMGGIVSRDYSENARQSLLDILRAATRINCACINGYGYGVMNSQFDV